MNTIRFWFHNSRPQALPQSMLPALLALCLASAADGFSLWLGLLAVVGVFFGHLGLNLFDDYFDYVKKKQDYREAMVHEGFRARIS
ncbi:MAG: prenyltransferase, partial [Dysgonamonadaceae bacterium]|nr:prenyltransferase [Dysgonamonadaceae bacterium]